MILACVCMHIFAYNCTQNEELYNKHRNSVFILVLSTTNYKVFALCVFTPYFYWYQYTQFDIISVWRTVFKFGKMNCVCNLLIFPSSFNLKASWYCVMCLDTMIYLLNKQEMTCKSIIKMRITTTISAMCGYLFWQW